MNLLGDSQVQHSRTITGLFYKTLQRTWDKAKQFKPYVTKGSDDIINSLTNLTVKKKWTHSNSTNEKLCTSLHLQSVTWLCPFWQAAAKSLWTSTPPLHFTHISCIWYYLCHYSSTKHNKDTSQKRNLTAFQFQTQCTKRLYHIKQLKVTLVKLSDNSWQTDQTV